MTLSRANEQTVKVWWTRPLRCEACGKVTYRPPLSSRACAWCKGELQG